MINDDKDDDDDDDDALIKEPMITELFFDIEDKHKQKFSRVGLAAKDMIVEMMVMMTTTYSRTVNHESFMNQTYMIFKMRVFSFIVNQSKLQN